MIEGTLVCLLAYEFDRKRVFTICLDSTFHPTDWVARSVCECWLQLVYGRACEHLALDACGNCLPLFVPVCRC